MKSIINKYKIIYMSLYKIVKIKMSNSTYCVGQYKEQTNQTSKEYRINIIINALSIIVVLHFSSIRIGTPATSDQ